MNSTNTRTVSSRGLTLIELVMVLIILGTVAGLVIPQVSNLGRTSDMVATSKTQADIASNIQMHFMQLKRFPQGMDSLLTTDLDAIFLPEDLDTDGEQDTGLPDSGPHLDEQLEVIDLADLDSSNGSSFTRCMGRSGFDWVYDHDTSVLNANDSATSQRALDRSGPPMPVAAIMDGSDIAGAVFASTGGVIPDDIKLVAFGVGPNSSLLGKTMLNAPIYPGCDGSYYGRYVAIFKVYADGRRAQLAMVVDSYGRFPDYSAKMINETLPEGARRG